MSYSYLSKERSPKILVQAKMLLGTKEIVGNIHNKTIMSWAKGLGLEKIYTSDEIAWCLDGQTLVSTPALLHTNAIIKPHHAISSAVYIFSRPKLIAQLIIILL